MTTYEKIEKLDLQTLRRIAYYGVSMAERFAKSEGYPDCYALLRLLHEGQQPKPVAKTGKEE